MDKEFTKYDIEIAYAFMHQKQRVYEYSTMPWQRDDIEYAIGDYVGQMNPLLYKKLAKGRDRFLLDHSTFASDIREAIDSLEALLEIIVETE